MIKKRKKNKTNSHSNTCHSHSIIDWSLIMCWILSMNVSATSCNLYTTFAPGLSMVCSFSLFFSPLHFNSFCCCCCLCFVFHLASAIGIGRASVFWLHILRSWRKVRKQKINKKINSEPCSGSLHGVNITLHRWCSTRWTDYETTYYGPFHAYYFMYIFYREIF